MPRRIPLIAGMIVASATAVFAVRPVEHSPNAFQIDMLAAEFCQKLAAGTVRGKTSTVVVREKIKTSPEREAERHVGFLVRAEGAQRQLFQYSIDCYASWTENGMMLLDLTVKPLRSFYEIEADDRR